VDNESHLELFERCQILGSIYIVLDSKEERYLLSGYTCVKCCFTREYQVQHCAI